jgi:glycosyltransferase involved in cell wall biosynthesis
MKPCKVTYIIIFYNQRRWVNEAIKSAYEQTYNNIEFIFSDDASTDGTFEEIEKTVLKYDEKLKSKTNLLSSEKNLGIVAHCNKVLTLASGEIISMNAGDDLSAPTRIEKAALCFQNVNIAMVFSNQLRINADGKIIDSSCYSQNDIKSFEQMINDGSPGITGAGAIWRRETFTKFGPLPMSIANEDDQLLIRARILGDVLLLKEPLFYYRVHNKSASSWLRNFHGSNEQLIRQEIFEQHNRIEHIKTWQSLILVHYDKDKAVLLNNLDKKIEIHTRKISLLKINGRLDRFRLCKTFEEMGLALVPSLVLRSIRVWRHTRYFLGSLYRSKLKVARFRYLQMIKG